MTDTMIFTPDQKSALVETFNTNPSGCFISIQGYASINGCGEVANYQLQSGINYGNIVKMSIEKLEKIKEGTLGDKTVHVKCQTYKNPDGTFSNRKSKERTLVTFEKDYANTDKEFQDACDEIMEGLKNPKESTNVYEKEATGLYSIEGEALYIRDCLVHKKTITKFGERPVSATLPENALKEAIRRMLPANNYRTFKLDLERFERIAINHTEIVPW
jgi:hypothetical protein